VIAYAAIALEHPLRINKSGSALVGAMTIVEVVDAHNGFDVHASKPPNCPH
jgi:hypothetical protein